MVATNAQHALALSIFGSNTARLVILNAVPEIQIGL